MSKVFFWKNIKTRKESFNLQWPRSRMRCGSVDQPQMKFSRWTHRPEMIMWTRCQVQFDLIKIAIIHMSNASVGANAIYNMSVCFVWRSCVLMDIRAIGRNLSVWVWNIIHRCFIKCTVWSSVETSECQSPNWPFFLFILLLKMTKAKLKHFLRYWPFSCPFGLNKSTQ